MDRKTAEFQGATGLRCPPGCGECCESARPKATMIELLPAAQELFLRGEAELWLERISFAGESGPCVFYRPDPHVFGNGRCGLYEFRPSVCRLFGFATMKNKKGRYELVTCHRQKETDPERFRNVEEAISKGLSAPSFDHFLLRVLVLEPALAKERFPINQALRLALERYGLMLQIGSSLTNNWTNEREYAHARKSAGRGSLDLDGTATEIEHSLHGG